MLLTLLLLFVTVVCDGLEPIVNGMISYDMEPPYAVGTRATYTCNQGYELSAAGDPMRTCEEVSDGSGGSFRGTAPTCQRRFLSNVYEFLSPTCLHSSFLSQLSVMHLKPLSME